jgi:hypothetical protein
MIYLYDLELVQEVDWHRDSRMRTLWEKPRMMVRISPSSKSTLREKRSI